MPIVTSTSSSTKGTHVLSGTLRDRKDLEDAREVLEGSEIYQTVTGESKLMVTATISLESGDEIVVTFSLGIGDIFAGIILPASTRSV